MLPRTARPVLFQTEQPLSLRSTDMSIWSIRSYSGVFIAVLSVTLGCSKESVPPRPPAAEMKPKSRSRAVVAGKARPGAIILLETADGRELRVPSAATGMGQFGREFYPELLLVRTGQSVLFSNSDGELHSVRVVESDETTNAIVYNVVMPTSTTQSHVFDKPGFYDVRCDFHENMRAFIYAASTPYATIVGNDGTFTIDAVEPGAYRLTMLSQGHELQRTVDVVGPRTEVLELMSSAPG
jgi:plastocyanin